MARKDLIVVIAGDNSDLKKKLDQVKRDFSQLGKDLTNIGAKLTAAVTLPLLAAGGAALKLAGDYEQAEIAFTTMLGSAEKAKAFLQELEDFAKKTPFDFSGLVDASRRLIAMGFEAERVIPILTAVGDAAAATGSGAYGVDRITLALSQMRAKGKVSAEEMTRQLGQLIPAWEMLADEIGVSVPEAMKMAEQGMLDGAAAVDALVRQMTVKYGGAMEAQMTTLMGLFDRAKDSFLIAIRKIGTELTPMAKQIVESFVLPMISGVEKVASAFAKLPVSIQIAAVALAGLAAATGPVLFAIGQISLGITAVMGMKGPLLALATTWLPQAAAAVVNLGSTLGYFAGYATAAVGAAMASLVAGFRALAVAIVSGNYAAALSIVQGAFAGFAATLGTVLLPALYAASVAFVGWKIGEWAVKNIPGLARLGDAIVDFSFKLQKFFGVGPLQDAEDNMAELEYQVTKLAEALAAKDVVIERGAMSLIQWRDAMWEAAKGAGVASVATNDVAQAMALLDTLSKNSGDTAKAAIDKLTAAFNEGKITQDEYNTYLAKYKTLTQDAVKPTAELKQTIDQLIKSGELGVSSLDALSLTMLAFDAAVETGKESWRALSAELTEGNRTLKEQKQALDGAVQGWSKINPELAAAVQNLFPMKDLLSGVNVEQLKAADSAKGFSESLKADVSNLEQMKEKITWISAQLAGQNLTATERVLLQTQLNALTNEYNSALGVQVEINQRARDMWTSIEQAVRSFGSSLYDVFTGAQTLGQTFMTLLDDIARSIFERVIQGGLDLLKTSILETVAATDLLSAGWQKFFGVMGVQQAGGAAGGAADQVGGAGGGAAGAAGGLMGIIGVVTSIAQLVTSIFQSFQFAAMNKTLDLIEKEVRYSQIHLGFILEAMHTYMGENQWQRHEFFKESWTNLLARFDALLGVFGIRPESGAQDAEPQAMLVDWADATTGLWSQKMEELIEAVKAIAINVTMEPGADPDAEPQGMLVDWAEGTQAYFTDGLKVVSDALLLPLNLIRERLDTIDLNVYRQWLIPELEKQSGILTGIYLQLATMGAGEPVGEWIPNATMAPATGGGFSIGTLNISGVGRREILENFNRALEENGIPH